MCMYVQVNIKLRIVLLALSIFVLTVAEGFLLVDLLDDVGIYEGAIIPESWHSTLENISAIAILLVVSFLLNEMIELQRSKKTSEKSVQVASGFLSTVIVRQFTEWKLSESETDVAFLLMKGYSLKEIAELRAAQIGTIKSQCSTIYKKAGIAGRAELIAFFMEDLLATPQSIKPKS